MSDPNDPAYPHSVHKAPEGWTTMHTPGLKCRERAAIDLCVPDSGTDWLDGMIRKAQRQRLAGMAIGHIGDNLRESAKAAVKPGELWEGWTAEKVATACYQLADALLTELEKP